VVRLVAGAATLLLTATGCQPEPEPTCDLSRIDLHRTLVAVFEGETTACELYAYESFVDHQVAADRGPWSSEVRSVWSQDGMDFELDSITVLLSSAGVPEVRLHQGVYHLFYLDGDPERAKALARQGSDWFSAHGLGPFGSMRLAISTDGVHFEPEEEFGIEGLEPSWIADPEVIRLPDGRWRLYFLSVPLTEAANPEYWIEGTPHSIRYAESDDLIHWQERGEAAFGPFADPTVQCDDQQRCRMYSYGLDHSSSTDGGLSFEYHGPHEIRGFAPDFHQAEGDPLRLFVSSAAYGAPLQSFSHLEDERWIAEEGERLPIFTAEAPTLTAAPGGGWLMLYHMDLGVETWDDTGLAP
jgi:hypothetical protein